MAVMAAAMAVTAAAKTEAAAGRVHTVLLEECPVDLQALMGMVTGSAQIW